MTTPPLSLSRRTLLALIVLAIGVALFVIIHRVAGTDPDVTLPNGMMLGRETGWTMARTDTLVAADGKTTLARGVEFVCFNDRYIYVWSRERVFSGLYDAKIGGKVTGVDYQQAMTVSNLSSPDGGCNGYYTGWVGPGMILEGAPTAHLPLCDWRNSGNSALQNREWRKRRCKAGS